MKAITYREYGGPEVLHLEEVAKPVPKDDQLLVRVRAAALNPYDMHLCLPQIPSVAGGGRRTTLQIRCPGACLSPEQS
jgi:NADPH:quinone reductase-like Zn-dependent oxidoreductase